MTTRLHPRTQLLYILTAAAVLFVLAGAVPAVLLWVFGGGK